MSRDVYLCQFREEGQEDFKTDCAFLAGQLIRAVDYTKRITSLHPHVAEGQIYDVDLGKPVYRFIHPDKEEYLLLIEP